MIENGKHNFGISTHSLLAEGDETASKVDLWLEISTHSLLAEGDPRRGRDGEGNPYFNPLPPRGGRPAARTACSPTANFNPLPPRGGRPGLSVSVPIASVISTHSLLAEGDGV